ncbi:flagellar hook-basal body complex protein FliE [Helicobacter sp. MIT 99-5507]|uniref:flagellar hook-basal body complex protein FliE n=1 Tax=Helicobacter sp. MIT 99-5507 TaxID=152489 RepID=UPI0021612B2F|nr:flagellar hook-basal body complex protein FliE [Helicobacter sp. MIT 99-5507]
MSPNSAVSKKAPNKNFMDTMKEVIDEVNKDQKTSEKALSDVATGQIKDLHQAAIAIGKAETSMKVMLEVRNKAINAYKEILRTQV